MRIEQVTALRRAADDDGVDFDGLTVEPASNAYAVDPPDADAFEATGDLYASLREHADAVTNWYYWHTQAPQNTVDWDFLRWVERADELPVDRRCAAMTHGQLARDWGQLRITVELGAHGQRQYGLRHQDDAGRDAAELRTHRDPRDARDIATFDTDGRYRPLKTAPTLPGGWAFDPVDGSTLIEAVETFYPATVENWHAELRGELDVTHWDETARRQTGIYDVVDELDREAVDWVAEACCTDAECTKRREWEAAEDDEIDADPGDGHFPCREACSLVIAAARKWTKLEREQTHTYELELTPSEKDQLEAAVDAIADREVDDIREADVGEGANRYRLRYLRAKRFDEDGNVNGVPDEPEQPPEAEPSPE